MPTLPRSIHSAAQMRAVDSCAMSALGIEGYELMSRAGSAAFSILRERWTNAARITVVCGPGNNGGDGYVLGRLAREAGLEVSLVSIVPPGRLQGDAGRAYQSFIACGGQIQSIESAELIQADVIVDGLFGTGLVRPITGAVAELIQRINTADRPVLALDLPSGLDATTGAVHGIAIRADLTVSFAGLKLGFFLDAGPDCVGELRVCELGLPRAVFEAAGSVATRIHEDELIRLLPARKRASHKGDHGRVLVIGGAPGMSGAAALAGEAALRSGAGLVTVAAHPMSVAAIVNRRPELMTVAVEDAATLLALLERADVVALGPGLGQTDWSLAVFNTVFSTDKPLVLDADGLNLLAEEPRARERWVMTPHPAEAGRLLKRSTAEVQADRLDAVRLLATRFTAAAVLKGAASLVQSSREALPGVCTAGNPGMATAGMGDVLTGVIAGLIAQTGDIAASARVGVLVHAMAGDVAARRGERGLIATDVLLALRECLNPCS